MNGIVCIITNALSIPTAGSWSARRQRGESRGARVAGGTPTTRLPVSTIHLSATVYVSQQKNYQTKLVIELTLIRIKSYPPCRLCPRFSSW